MSTIWTLTRRDGDKLTLLGVYLTEYAAEDALEQIYRDELKEAGPEWPNGILWRIASHKIELGG